MSMLCDANILLSYCILLIALPTFRTQKGLEESLRNGIKAVKHSITVDRHLNESINQIICKNIV